MELFLRRKAPFCLMLVKGAWGFTAEAQRSRREPQRKNKKASERENFKNLSKKTLRPSAQTLRLCGDRRPYFTIEKTLSSCLESFHTKKNLYLKI